MVAGRNAPGQEQTTADEAEAFDLSEIRRTAADCIAACVEPLAAFKLDLAKGRSLSQPARQPQADDQRPVLPSDGYGLDRALPQRLAPLAQRVGNIIQ